MNVNCEQTHKLRTTPTNYTYDNKSSTDQYQAPVENLNSHSYEIPKLMQRSEDGSMIFTYAVLDVKNVMERLS